MDAVTYYWERFSGFFRQQLQITDVIVKCNKLATLIKEAGNVEYKMLNFKNAENIYRKALQVAVPNTKIYASILANLSAIKFFQRKYKSCIELVELSMKHNLDPKLYTREMKAWIGLGDLNGAKEAFAKLETTLKSFELQHKDTFLEESKKILNSPLGEQKYVQDDCIDMLIPEINMNPKYLNASENVELRFNKKYGKHVVARNDIKKGDAILIDRPYAAIGVSQCSNCFQLCVIPHPCTECCHCLYCSDACKQMDGEIHKWECKLFQLEFIAERQETFLAFRLFLKGLTSNTQLGIRKNNDVSCFGNAENNFPFVQNLFMDFKTFSNNIYFDERMKNWCFLMTYIVHHTKLLDMIKEKKIFGNINTEDLLIHETGKYLLQLQMICRSNESILEVNSDDINLLLYPSYGLFNNSCVPNTSKIFSTPYLMLLASEDISKGDQIFTAYCISNDTTTENRKRILKSRYGFNCECKFCSLPSQVCDEVIACPNGYHFCAPIEFNGFMCEICGYQFSFDTIKKLDYFTNCCKLLNTSQNIEYLRCAIKLIDELKVNPNHHIAKTCYLRLIRGEIQLGNLENGVQYISRIGAFQHDSFSIPYRDIYGAIERFTKKVFQSEKAFMQQFEKNVLEELVQFLTSLQEELRAKFPMKSILKGIDDLKAFYTIHLSILDLYETVNWLKN